MRISDWSSDVCSSDLGANEVVRAHAALTRLRHGQPELVRYAFVNGLPGFVTREPDGVLQTTALLIEDGLIRAIYVLRNPDMLRHLERSVHYARTRIDIWRRYQFVAQRSSHLSKPSRSLNGNVSK